MPEMKSLNVLCSYFKKKYYRETCLKFYSEFLYCKVAAAQSYTLGNILIQLTVIVTRKVILHLDNEDQAIFLPTVINSKLVPELNFKENITSIIGYLTSKSSLRITTRNNHCRHIRQITNRMQVTLYK